ncbi:peptidase M48 Ste24p [Gordonia bronchialis DSM 43247]|uniref:Peptidase M48 Ste24p n=1 Tax=Gordonia bronchialis (strain ATCC 25592 / DSM 43247 / BCRC 13721 / JCM 3198 / KCTC 3076 / NBRC 16047 / NCTC 10667) TaxID=526226 RepID=D0LEX7_GORB4|nr:peptidase M48 Ste24p [Gordonia bronchialis DSM 43247]QGS24552.1 M48 family metalloprotease [Gordonia bronchialis]STQ64745.1 Peptidase family M48 [Gordonia bronchialis]
MSVALAHLVGAAVLAVLAPYVLDRLPARWSPRVVMTAWVSSIATTLALLALSALTALLPDPPPAEQFVEALARCASAVLHALRDDFSQLYGFGVVVAAAAVVARTAGSYVRHTRRSWRIQRLHRDVVAVVGSTEADTPDVLWIDHPYPMAYCVGGRSGFVVATSALKTDLSPEARAAVLAHEFAHLRSRHHRVVGFCDVMARALPLVPLFRRAPAAVSALAEVDADMVAARTTSSAAVRAALTSIGAAGGSAAGGASPALGGAHAGSATRYRLRMLEQATTEPTAGRYALAGMAPLAASAMCAAMALPALSLLVHGLTASY